jgi:enterochelin esterase-like enzyme
MRPALVMTAALLTACASSAPKPVAASRVETYRLESVVFGNARTIRVWLPPGYDDAAATRTRYPVMILNDGFAVFSSKSWNALSTLDSLVTAGAIPPIVLVGVDNGATAEGGSAAQRTREYVPYRDPQSDPDTAEALGDRYPSFLVDEVLPTLSQRFRVRDDADGRGIGGASYGGVAALYTVLHHPGVFSRLLLESTPMFLAEDALRHEAENAKLWPRRVYLGAGTAEADDAAMNAKVVATVRDLEAVVARMAPATATSVRIEEGAGHNGKIWGGRFGEAMQFLWGGK